MADCAINIKPSEDELVEIATETVQTARTFGINPKVAFLSYSTHGSGKGDDVDKMRNACEKAKLCLPGVLVDGELQLTPLCLPVSCGPSAPSPPSTAMPTPSSSPISTRATSAIKSASVWAVSTPYGPILQGLNAPINDLSRGCNAQEVYSMAIITAALA